MKNKFVSFLLLCVSLGLGAQTVRQAVGANGTNTVSFPATVAGNLNVIVAVPGHYSTIAGVSATDSKGQAYKLDGSCGTPDGDGYMCVFYVCSGAGGVVSATVNGIDGIAAINFIEGQGTIASGCAGTITTAAGTVAPCQISLTPDQPHELAIVGFATAGPASSVNGNVNYSNQLDFGADPVATTITTSTATLTVETDSGSPGCVNTDNENPNGYNAVFAAFRTQPPSSVTCPATATVPSSASCSYSQNLDSQAARSTSSTQTVNVSIAAGTTVGSIAVLTTGMAGMDFASATGSTCTASTYTTATSCGVKVKFTPQAAGLRRGAVVFYSGANSTGTVLATVPIYGVGTGPQVAYGPGGTQSNVGSGYSTPKGVAVDAAGNVYVADATAVFVNSPGPSPYAGSIYKLTTGGTRTTLGGPFAYPVAVAVDGAGNVYVADSNAAAVGKIPPVGTQTTIGSGFSDPVGVAVDGAGNVYVADMGNVAVYKITPGGAQTTVGNGFSQPASVAVDGAGNVYVADPGVPAVYKITPSGTQTTVSSGISKPEAVAVDAAGSVYIFDQNSGTVYEVTPGGTESTVATGFGGQAGMAVDAAGNLYVADTSNVRVVKIDRAEAPSLSFASTDRGSTSSDSPRTVEVENIGNAALTLSALSYPTDFPEATGDSNACTSTISLIPAELCDLSIDFIPKSVASLSEDVTLTDNALNVARAKQLIAVRGTGLSAGIAQTITFTPPPSPVTYGVGAITLSATGGASGNPVTFSVLSGPGSVSGSQLTITGAGTVVVAANQAGNANYSAAAQVTRSITVAKAILAVTANKASRLYLAANPTFTYAITGFVSGDTSSVVSGSATLTTTATASSAVGTYPITFSAESLAAANYTFGYVSGTLTIFDKSLTTIASLTATAATIKVFGFGFTAPNGQLAFTDTTSGKAVLAPVTLNTSTATTSLLPQVTTSTGANTLPVWTMLGDINGDGKLDLVTSLYLTDSVSVQLGNGDGSFQTATTILIAKGFGPAENHLVSLRGNGTLDLIVASFNTNQIAVLLGNGNGTFRTPVFYTVGSAVNTPISLATGDFNNDGKLDVAVANTGDNTISVLLGNGSGALTPSGSAIAVGHDPEAIRAGDFNGDGYSDLAVANYQDGTVTTLLNNKNGTFTATTVSVGSGAGSGPQALAVNGSGSGFLLAVANYNDNTVSVLHSNGNGTFAAQKVVNVGKGPDDVAFADFNGDGIPDLAASNYTSGTTSLALGSSGGSYTVLAPFTVGKNPYSAAVGDVDLDGTPDIVVSNCFSNNTGVLLSGDQISVPYTGLSIAARHILHAAYTPNVSSNYGSSTSANVTAP